MFCVAAKSDYGSEAVSIRGFCACTTLTFISYDGALLEKSLIKQRPRNAERRYARMSQASPQQRSGIASGGCGIAENAEHASNKTRRLAF